MGWCRSIRRRRQRASAAARRYSCQSRVLLRALLVRPGAILSRSELEDRIYGWGEVESNAVEFLIHALRLAGQRRHQERQGRGMDGLKNSLGRRLNESVQLKLSFTLSLAILALAIVAGASRSCRPWAKPHELQDVLRQVAPGGSAAPAAGGAGGATEFKQGDEEARVIVQGPRRWRHFPAERGRRRSLPLPQPCPMACTRLRSAARRSVYWSRPRVPASVSRSRRNRASAMKSPVMARCAP